MEPKPNLCRVTEKQLEARRRLLTEAGLRGDEERDINGLALLPRKENTSDRPREQQRWRGKNGLKQ